MEARPSLGIVLDSHTYFAPFFPKSAILSLPVAPEPCPFRRARPFRPLVTVTFSARPMAMAGTRPCRSPLIAFRFADDHPIRPVDEGHELLGQLPDRHGRPSSLDAGDVRRVTHKAHGLVSLYLRHVGTSPD